ncbi:MAG: DUF1244 domain-containing protein [Pseudomonadota bacterium]
MFKIGDLKMDMDAQTKLNLEAAAFRRLVAHLRKRDDVQNIDLMIMAGFCRNCLADWLADAASDAGQALDKDEARQLVYGMPYKEWKAQQPEATAEQVAAFEATKHPPT